MYDVITSIYFLWIYVGITSHSIAQTRLEELLRLYPPETVERRRYEKVAKALGTRTPQQVRREGGNGGGGGVEGEREGGEEVEEGREGGEV